MILSECGFADEAVKGGILKKCSPSDILKYKNL